MKRNANSIPTVRGDAVSRKEAIAVEAGMTRV
jgi:hypothetical protein